MPVQCGQCGHENNPQYRFCGMCGARLQPLSPPVEAAPPERAPRSVSGPSFLGLADEPPRNNLDYLLEDDAPSGHGRLYVLLLVLLLAALFLGWRWHRDGYPWAGSTSGAAVSGAPATAPTSAGPGTSAPPSATAEADHSAADHSTADHSTADQGAAASEKIDLGPLQAAQPAPVRKPPAPQIQAPEAPVPEPQAAESPASATQPPETGSADQVAPRRNGGSESDKSNGKRAEPSTPPPASAKKVAAPAFKVAEGQPANPLVTYDDKLVADGERYLYGNGVPQSCERAQKNLFSAAQRANPKAQSVLGAMYATGHCVNRDLPAAYRWFAKALRQEPGNERVAQDLEVLWKQMTPSERQVAVRGQQ